MTLLHASPSDRYAAVVRAAVFGAWLAKAAADPLPDLATLPPDLFDPPAPVRWLPRPLAVALLAPAALVAVRGGLAAAAAACLSRRLLPWAGPACCGLATAHQAVVRGFGHVNHAELPLLYAAYAFAAGAWLGRGRNPEPLAATALLLLTYLLTGAHRLAHGLGAVADDSVVYWVAANSWCVSDVAPGLGAWLADRPAAWPALRAGFVVATAAEVASPLALVSARFRAAYLAAMLGFHATVLATMNILFWENCLLLVVLLAPHPRRAVASGRP